MGRFGGVSSAHQQDLYNASTTAQGAGFSTDTYLTNSNITIPNSSLQIGSRFTCTFSASKTAASTATPIIAVRIGTNGTTADTAVLTFTFNAQTAAADVGRFNIEVLFRSVGSGTSAVVQGTASVIHSVNLTGLISTASQVLQVTSAGFDSTVSSSIIGVSVNGGTSASWTVQSVQSKLENLI